jgi:hypothetical protein
MLPRRETRRQLVTDSGSLMESFTANLEEEKLGDAGVAPVPKIWAPLSRVPTDTRYTDRTGMCKRRFERPGVIRRRGESVDFEARVPIVVLAYGQRRWKAESNLDALVGFLEGSITLLLEFGRRRRGWATMVFLPCRKFGRHCPVREMLAISHNVSHRHDP